MVKNIMWKSLPSVMIQVFQTKVEKANFSSHFNEKHQFLCNIAAQKNIIHGKYFILHVYWMKFSWKHNKIPIFIFSIFLLQNRLHISILSKIFKEFVHKIFNGHFLIMVQLLHYPEIRADIFYSISIHFGKLPQNVSIQWVMSCILGNYILKNFNSILFGSCCYNRKYIIFQIISPKMPAVIKTAEVLSAVDRRCM
jgi:hypothetical protein